MGKLQLNKEEIETKRLHAVEKYFNKTKTLKEFIHLILHYEHGGSKSIRYKIEDADRCEKDYQDVKKWLLIE